MEHIYHTLHELGIKRTYHGYFHLATAIELVLEDEERLLYICKWLYQEIAMVHKTTPSCVERNIRTVKRICWNNGGRDKLESLAGYQLLSMPSNSEFIDIISCYIKEQYFIVRNE